MSDRRSQIVIISPVFNEQDNIDYFFGRLCAAIDRCDRNKYTFTLVFTNNRSTDGTLDKLKSLHAAHDWVQYLTLSRNHGYQLSVLSGLTTFEADFYMVCDVDCEDPPEVLLTFLERIEQGGDYVYGIRSNRPDHCLLGKMRAAFYFTLRCLGDYPVVPYMSEFALFRRKVRDNLIRGNSSLPAHGSGVWGIRYRRRPLSTRGTQAWLEPLQLLAEFQLCGRWNFIVDNISTSRDFLHAANCHLSVSLGGSVTGIRSLLPVSRDQYPFDRFNLPS